MTALAKARPRQKKLMTILAIVASTLILLIASWLYFQPRIPHPLGNQMEYIGKRDYGCAGVWLCDSQPGTTYLYATNLTPPELVTYFKNAQAADYELQVERWMNRGESFDIELFNKNSSERLFMFFESKPNHEVTTDLGSTELTKQYIVRIDSKYYDVAKKSL